MKAILQHPLNADRKVMAGLGLARRVLGAKRGVEKVPFDWVNETRMLRGSAVTNGNDQCLFGMTEFRDMAFLLHYLRAGDLFCDVGRMRVPLAFWLGLPVGLGSLLASRFRRRFSS